jgi:CheY-like chemotaxis protein
MISKVLADKKGLTFNNIFDEMINFYVKSDSYRLVQILLNLINNAIKYTSEGQVSIQVSLVHQDEKIALIEFMVADTGRGIPASKLETIFEGYTQSSVSDTRVYGGTGLGLTITKELVSLFDGNISVESKENFGSKFYVTIQFEKCEMPASEKNTVSQVEMERDFYVLLAEDNKLNYMLLRKQLETIYKNIKIDHAIDGKEAIEFFNAKKYDLIIMDMFMPEMDGITATKTIRSNENTFKSKVPILAFTGNTTKEDMDKCYAAGMNDILIKPYKIDDLKAKINHLIL